MERTLFDILDYMQDFDHDVVPICPPESDEDYAPTTSTETPYDVDLEDLISDENQNGDPPESVFEPLEELVPGGVGKVDFGVNRKHWILVEFCCSPNSSLKRVAEHVKIAYLGVTKEDINVENPDTFEQFLLWLQIEVQEGEGPVHLWSSIPCTKWPPWQHMAISKYGKSFEEKLEVQRDESRAMVL